MSIKLHDIVEALEKDQIVPFFQPQVELRTGRLKGFEVLARWQHPEFGPVLPSNFISLAEENGLIATLTEQICRKAFAVSHLLPEDLTLAVNVSPIQMRDSSLPPLLRESAEAAGFPLHRLIVEITETALHSNLCHAQKLALELKSMGCRLSLDDFGTGYSSLKHLQSFPFDELKIDRSFISSVATDRASRKIAAAIIGLGQSLGLDTIAEGIETEEQADMLIWLGCEQGQGWRYGHPAGADEIAAMIAAEPIVALSSLTSPGDDWATSSLEALPTLRLAQLQAIYDGAPVGLCFLDSKLRYVSLNERLAEMNGLPVKAHIGRSVEELYPKWFPVFEPFLRRALNGEAISGVDLQRPSLGGGDAERQLLASYQPAWDEADEVIGISISLLDVTAHRPSDYEAYREPALHEFIFEVNPEVPWVMDSEGNNLQVSSRWVRTTPLGKDRTRNLRWLEALHSDDLEATIRTMKHALRTGKPIDVEYRILGPDGTWRWMRSTGSPRFGPSGAITRWYGSVEDIHDRKMHEQKNLSEMENHNREDYEALSKGMVLAEALQDSVSDSGRASGARDSRA
jgi:PAS domain S-box-containing protein